MKKLFNVLVVLFLTLALVGCQNGNKEPQQGGEENTTYKVGMVCIGDDNAAYDRNFYMAADKAKEILASEGINIEWIYTYNHPEGDPVAVDNEELALENCVVVFNNSYGQEPAMLTVAKDYPDTYFVGLTNENSWKDNLDNTLNAFPSIYEGRYLAGVVAGLKLNEMIASGEINSEEAVLGYVGAYTFAEVVSGYTAFFLGARSVCPEATMLVEFIGSWSDPTMEATTAQDLIDRGAVIVSQHSDSTTPATTAQNNGKYHVGYNIDMSDVAPEASLCSSRIDWTNYFVYVIKCAINGEAPVQDYHGYGLKTGDVVLTTINEKIAASDTINKVAEIKTKIENGEINVFDTNTFTVNGEKVTTCFALDTNGDFAADSEEAVFEEAFHESYFQSAPYFALRIDGITLVNEAY